MKFICPKCGMREEKVVGDDTLCPICMMALIEVAPGYANLLMSPNEAIRRFETVIVKRGFPQAWSGRVKQEREAWISAVWALGLREITGKEYWIEVEARDQTPDCKVRYVDSSPGYNLRGTINVEIVEWDHHRPDVMDVITPKCAKKYPRDFCLLVFARNGTRMGTDAIQQIKSLVVPFKEIWVLGRVSVEGAKYRMFTVHPSSVVVDFDLFEVLQENSSQKQFAQFEKRSKRTEMSDRGMIHLPIP
jgi:hypothetical protein